LYGLAKTKGEDYTERMKRRFKLIVSMQRNLLLDSLLEMIYGISARVGEVEYQHGPD